MRKVERKQIDETIPDDVVLGVASQVYHEQNRRGARACLHNHGYVRNSEAIAKTLEIYAKRKARLGSELSEYGEMLEDCKEAVMESPIGRMPRWTAGVGVGVGNEGTKYLTRNGKSFVAVFCCVWTDEPISGGIEFAQDKWVFMAQCCGCHMGLAQLASILDEAAETANILWGEESEERFKADAKTADA